MKRVGVPSSMFVKYKEVKMAKYRRKPDVIDVELYKKGMEDGFEFEEYMYPTEELVNFKLKDTETTLTTDLDRRVYPYIQNCDRREFIFEGAYIAKRENGERFICSKEWLKKHYEPIKNVKIVKSENFDWFFRNFNELEKQYPGEWLAIKNREVVAHNSDMSLLSKKLREHNINGAFISKVDTDAWH